jgi:cytoskeleton protein RodZ
MDVKTEKLEEQDGSVNIGALLCEARDNLGLSSEDIATELNLAVDIITRIEVNQFVQEIPTAFIRGYVKSYATKVGLDTKPILSEFDRQTGAESPSLQRVQTISKFGASRKELNSSSYLIKGTSIVLVLLFLSFAGWKVWKQYMVGPDEQSLANDQQGVEAELIVLEDGLEPELETQDPIVSTEEVEQLASSQSLPIVDSSTPETDNLEDGGSAADNRASELGSVTPSPNESDVEQTESPSTDSSILLQNLVMDFSADCWVRIVDARGEVIALGVKQNGKHMVIEGVAPITVVLGDPSAVSINYAGSEYDLSSYRAGRRAEIILN